MTVRCSHAMETKRALRSRLRAARAARTPDELDRAGLALAAHAVAEWGHARRVAAYASVRTEPPTRPLVDALTDAGVEVLLPVVTPAGLDWALYGGWSSLVEARGLLEPSGPRLGPEALLSAEVVLMPALAVDLDGHRLGQGGGYYDRATVTVPVHRLVAVVFAEDVLTELPVESYDVPVGAILTPDGLRLLTS